MHRSSCCHGVRHGRLRSLHIRKKVLRKKISYANWSAGRVAGMAAPGGTGADVGGTTGGAGGFAGEGKDDGVAVEAGAKGEAAAGRPAIALAVDVEVCEVPKHSTAEFAELFEGVRKRMQAGDVPLRVATVSLRAPSDQSKWSSVVAAEREMLMAEVCTRAPPSDLCDLLTAYSITCLAVPSCCWSSCGSDQSEGRVGRFHRAGHW